MYERSKNEQFGVPPSDEGGGFCGAKVGGRDSRGTAPPLHRPGAVYLSLSHRLAAMPAPSSEGALGGASALSPLDQR